MANSRIMLVCKHCGESFCLGKGYFGNYSTGNERIFEQLNEFYGVHSSGMCTDGDFSDNARKHFVILEEGEELDTLIDEELIKENVITEKEQIIEIKEIINSIYGCDSMYYGVDSLTIACLLYDKGYRKHSEFIKGGEQHEP